MWLCQATWQAGCLQLTQRQCSGSASILSSGVSTPKVNVTYVPTPSPGSARCAVCMMHLHNHFCLLPLQSFASVACIEQMLMEILMQKKTWNFCSTTASCKHEQQSFIARLLVASISVGLPDSCLLLHLQLLLAATNHPGPAAEPLSFQAAQVAADAAKRQQAGIAAAAKKGTKKQQQQLSLSASTSTGQQAITNAQKQELDKARQASESLGRLLTRLPSRPSWSSTNSIAQVSCCHGLSLRCQCMACLSRGNLLGWSNAGWSSFNSVATCAAWGGMATSESRALRSACSSLRLQWCCGCP